MINRDPTTKGSILRGLLKFLERDLTAEQFGDLMLAIPAEDHVLIDPKAILATQKIPEAVLNRLTVEAARVKREPLETFGRRAGSAELAEAVGVYRFLTIVLTPAALLRKASSMWSTVHSHGTLKVDEEKPGSATVSLIEFPSEPAHCARLSGWFEGAGKMTHSKNALVVHDLCLTRGADRCRWQLTWSA